MGKSILIISVTLLFSCSFGKKNNNSETVETKGKTDHEIVIPPGGNSWVVNNLDQNHELISDKGIRNWTDSESVIRTFFKTDTIGEIRLSLKIKVPTGKSKIRVAIDDDTEEIRASNPNYGQKEVGTFYIDEPGYHYIEVQGLEKTGDVFADIDKFLISGPATKSEITFVKDDFYFGRRGPSDHLNYQVPEDIKVKWFYNEITVPKGEDVIGSYFMACGFGEGYFGIQVNSKTERRILFSVWSPYKTQDPMKIPDDYKIILLDKGEDVKTGEFGNEGSGGQSYKIFDWKAGTTYKFLLKGEPLKSGMTDYTAYFLAPETGEWMLIASFRRPYTETYLTHLYSFLENFTTETGFISRKAYYSNQWIHDTTSKWHELTKAKFTADATARKGSRADYAGGSEGNKFFLKNCGFFNNSTKIGTVFERKANGAAPAINFYELEQ